MKTVRTAMQILNLFTPEMSRLSVTHIAERSGLTVSTASRLLAALRSNGLLQQAEDKRYEPGPLAHRLGSLYRSRNPLSDLVGEAARRLVDETGLSCWISVLSGADALVISRIAGRSSSPFLVHPGGLLPAHASAGGKALLARLPARDVVRLVAKTLLPRTDRTLQTRESLLAELEQVRERGWSMTDQELFTGMISVGAAVGSPHEPTAMSISLSFPSSSRTKAEVEALGRRVAETARDIGLKVGDTAFQAAQPSSIPPRTKHARR